MTAIQMDVKVGGVTYDVLSSALEQAQEGRQFILREMRKCHLPPRRELSPYAPHIRVIQIDPEAKGRVIGPSGKYIRALEEMSGVDEVIVDESGEIEIDGPSFETVQRAIEMIHLMAGDITPGQLLKNVVVSGVKTFGAFVDFAPGRTGLVHVSELTPDFVENVDDVVKVGDSFDVEVISATRDGRFNLSRRLVLLKEKHQAEHKAQPPIARPPNATKTALRTADVSAKAS